MNNTRPPSSLSSRRYTISGDTHRSGIPHIDAQTRSMTPGTMSTEERHRTGQRQAYIDLRHPPWPPVPAYTGPSRSREQIRAETLERTINARKSTRQRCPPGDTRITLPSFRESFPPLSDLVGPAADSIKGRQLISHSQLLPSPLPPQPLTAIGSSSTMLARPRFAFAPQTSYDSLLSNVDNRGLATRGRSGTYEDIRDCDTISLSQFSDDDAKTPPWTSSSECETGSPVDSNSVTAQPNRGHHGPPTGMLPIRRLLVPSRTPDHLPPVSRHGIKRSRSPDMPASPPRTQRITTFRAFDGKRSPIRRPRPRNPVRQLWEDYAEEKVDGDGDTHFQCLWKKDGPSAPTCEYRAQKQAMKRHIEATHLGFKPHQCEFCPKAFGQKTALKVHEATHTGATPLKCGYENCNKSYSDPARRYRHHVKVHGYIPRQGTKAHISKRNREKEQGA